MIPFIALIGLAGFGAGSFTVAPEATTLDYSQDGQGLRLVGTDALGGVFGGVFTQSSDWTQVEEAALEAQLTGANPNAFFTILLYSGENFSLARIYQGETSSLGEAGAIGRIPLTAIGGGDGDLSNISGVEFSWGGAGEAVNILLRKLVDLSVNPPNITFGGFVGGSFVLRWEGSGNAPVNVERATDLRSGNWTTVATGVTSREYIDANPPSKMAFYRLAYSY